MATFCRSLLVIALLLFVPSFAQAADSKITVHFVRQEDGSAFGELSYNEQVVWRIKVCSDGAEPTASWNNSKVTVVVPDVVNGMFLVKVYNE